jgi:hypothetical protein
MRGRLRRVVATAVAGAVVVLSGCSSPPAVGDGQLGVEWAAMPTPTVPAPQVGACTALPDGSDPVRATWTVSLDSGSTVDCSEHHVSETLYVGTFPADVDTDPNTVPTPGTARFRHAYDVCAHEATGYLGRDFHTSQLAVIPVMPNERQWAGRARWFRCEVFEVADSQRTAVERDSSLHGSLTGLGELTTTCADVTLNASRGAVTSFRYSPCGQPHDVELTGPFVLQDGDYPGRDRAGVLVSAGCQPVGAQYVGVAVGVLLRPGSAAYTFGTEVTADSWSVGERTSWCFYGAKDAQRTGSVRNLGRAPY